jgi:uncharacterized protein YgiM (DUF1202 family)
MGRITSRIWIAASLVCTPLMAAGSEPAPATVQPAFKSFTGKVKGNRVRLRSGPSLGNSTVRELNTGDMLVVVGEENDFYAVLPPTGLKGYIYRTYVLDNVIEGNHVNVRLAPDLESPIVAQMNTGDPVKGIVARENNKWLEMELPATARLYVAKDYLETAGGPDLYQERTRRSSEVAELLNAAYLVSQAEMRKPYGDIDMKRVERAFDPVVTNYSDFPSQVAKAKEALKQIQDLYTQKKVTHLEAKQLDGPNVSRAQRKELEGQVKSQQERLAALESQVEQTLTLAQQAVQNAPKPVAAVQPKPKVTKTDVEVAKAAPAPAKGAPLEKPVAAKPVAAPVKAPIAVDKPKVIEAPTAWTGAEEHLYQTWSQGRESATQEAFYMEEMLNAVELIGVVEPYREQLHNRPGDYILYDNYKPLGYLYSTQVDLAAVTGKRVKMRLAERPNHHFAFPAYFVLSAEPA